MVTVNDLFEISGNKMMNDIQKSFIRRIYSPDIAESLCASIDVHEKADGLKRFVREYDEWYVNQLRWQATLLQNLRSTGCIIVIPV